MSPQTHYSFEVQYPAHASSPKAQRDELMAALGLSLQQLAAVQDSTASVTVSDSHKGEDHKLVELTTHLQNPQMNDILQTFSQRHGVIVTPLE